MSTSSYFTARFPSVLILAALLSVLPNISNAQDALPPGARPATAADLPLMRAAGIPNPTIGMPWDPSNAYIGQVAGGAKQFLKNLPRTGSAANDFNIDMLNSAFTICSATFLKAFESTYGPVTITSAYRSPADEARLCVNNSACGTLMNVSNPNGLHQQGFAMDVKFATQSTLINYARQNPQFGVCFPFTGEGGGFTDQVHMILAGINSAETKGPGCAGVTKACIAGNFDQNAIVQTAQGAPISQAALNWQQFPQNQPPYAMVYQSPGTFQSPPLAPYSTPYQQVAYMPPPPSPPMYPQVTSSFPSVPLNGASSGGISNTSSGGTAYGTGAAVASQPLYATSTFIIPSASLIIAQSTRLARNASTVISWSSVGMVSESCVITQNNLPFASGPQGSAVLSKLFTSAIGDIALRFTCRDFSGGTSTRSVTVTVE